MNAYELADRLENELNLSENLFVFDAANMLRQQADYIKHLEEGLESSLALNKAQVERQNVACNFMENSCTLPCNEQVLRTKQGCAKMSTTLHDYISLKTMDDFQCNTCKLLIQAKKLSLLAKQVDDYSELQYEAIKLDHYIKEFSHDHSAPGTPQ
jgi:hypothetical protein